MSIHQAFNLTCDQKLWKKYCSQFGLTEHEHNVIVARVISHVSQVFANRNQVLVDSNYVRCNQLHLVCLCKMDFNL